MSHTTPADDPAALGRSLHTLAAELYPLVRSITGDGFRQSLSILSRVAPLKITEVPTGKQAFDWQVPREWNIRDAWVKDPSGRKVIDFQQSNLHVVSYSTPVHKTMPLAELRPHLHSLPDQPSLVPYRTSFYKDAWGFCLAHDVLQTLPDGDYEVFIDATLAPGSLTYGECVLPGNSQDEVLLSCHACHPSLANDNLAAMSICAHLMRELAALPERRYTYRLIYAPGTIGSIVWLSENERHAERRVKHGLVCTCLGDPGPSTYKTSRRGNAEIDRAVPLVLRDAGTPHNVIDFIPYGYDERNYCSPGFNLPVGALMRTPWGQYKEYHTSADNLDFITPEAMVDSYAKLRAVVDVLEHNRAWVNTNPKCEPQLGKRGLYRTTGGTEPGQWNMALLWVLNQSDGQHTLLDIAERSKLPFRVIKTAAAALKEVGLLTEPDPDGHPALDAPWR